MDVPEMAAITISNAQLWTAVLVLGAIALGIWIWRQINRGR